MSNRILALICARGGSKGLPGKNVRPLAGRPVIAWSVEAALGSSLIDRVVVSTDDPAIAEVARAAGAEVPFLRPAELASDTASLYDVIFHALEALDEEPSHVVLLQATSPLRIAADIDGCIRLCLDHGAPAAASLCEPGKSPYWMFLLDPDGTVRPVIPHDASGGRRQDLPVAWAPNGAVYVAETAWLRRERNFWKAGVTLGYVMPLERSVDIDSLLDFRVAEMLMSDRLGPKAG
ncbi:cytidylyltransferase domain-containing protein [Paramagnetospirillum magneticum]|uniref:CMP-N-acetylneuraminic acid synthetase n=1 Tax=Paramagnetospirillum magneticum (strain ATCC 700264 / AMB-1) TaxID=342108 RepID=Q2WB83_PARM1|nr:acylneuraminate cytidylyltransferase family protein [Paramagnetospirillum magneticum]BAE48892.1 CMP-N-acetylneuraminic acid synthetase [Paramagnetospirillum magneticum AMB-1]